MRIHGLIHIRYHIKYMYSLRRIYDLMRISYHIFHMYIISHVLAISHLLTNFRSHNTYGLPIFCVTWPHTEPMPYIPPQTEFATSTAYTTYTVFSPWKLSTGTGVTPTVSHFSWDWKSFSLLLARSQFIWFLFTTSGKWLSLVILYEASAGTWWWRLFDDPFKLPIGHCLNFGWVSPSLFLGLPCFLLIFTLNPREVST